MVKWSLISRRGPLVLYLAVAPTVAMAYIDPGNGAYMVQALFTVIGAALFYLRHPVRTLKSIWNRLLRRETSNSAPGEPPQFAAEPMSTDSGSRETASVPRADREA